MWVGRADKLGKERGETVFVENRAGAGGNFGTRAAATSSADGYTIVIGTTPRTRPTASAMPHAD